MDEEEKKLLINARKPEGELGSQILDRMNKSHEKMAVWAVNYLNISSNDLILDIGCGGGANLKRFSKLAFKTYGIDYSKVSVSKSKKLNKEEIDCGKIEVYEGSVSSLPFEDEFFNIVTGFETVYFWPDFLKDLAEVKRVLKKNGLIFLCNEMIDTMDNRKIHADLIELLSMNIFNEDSFKKAFDKLGFVDFQSFIKNDWICVIARKV